MNKSLPSQHSVKRHAIRKAGEKQKEVIDYLELAINRNGYVGITTDMWTDYIIVGYTHL